MSPQKRTAPRGQDLPPCAHPWQAKEQAPGEQHAFACSQRSRPLDIPRASSPAARSFSAAGPQPARTLLLLERSLTPADLRTSHLMARPGHTCGCDERKQQGTRTGYPAGRDRSLAPHQVQQVSQGTYAICQSRDARRADCTLADGRVALLSPTITLSRRKKDHTQICARAALTVHPHKHTAHYPIAQQAESIPAIPTLPRIQRVQALRPGRTDHRRRSDKRRDLPLAPPRWQEEATLVHRVSMTWWVPATTCQDTPSPADASHTDPPASRPERTCTHPTGNWETPTPGRTAEWIRLPSGAHSGALPGTRWQRRAQGP